MLQDTEFRPADADSANSLSLLAQDISGLVSVPDLFVGAKPPDKKPEEHGGSRLARIPGWRFSLAFLLVWGAVFAITLKDGIDFAPSQSAAAWLVAGLLHVPFLLLLTFLAFGTFERIGYYFQARKPVPGGILPARMPRVCIQLPMFNEDAVARRIIAAAAAIHWPKQLLEIQVLDDSTEIDTRLMVERLCAEISAESGTTIHFMHRTDRSGYKAGALEVGRHLTDAEFIAIFDADFVPPPDYLTQAIPHFYDGHGSPLADLALVQAQWGHLNDDQSRLTGAQALWVDDHHTLQQSWRSAAIGFVNFTGTAGTWRASALEAAGGWKSSSLVEDCEISFRVLFAGYRTKFVKELVVPAELPQTIAAYRLQQKRWTQGWVQLQRMHLARLLFQYRTPLPRKAYLAYMMCIGWQWPLWFIWMAAFPFLMAQGLALTSLSPVLGMVAYLAPPIIFAICAGLAATTESRATYARRSGGLRSGPARRFWRLFPYLIVNAGMLPHHFCAFVEGLFGPMNTEFERTPKTAAITVSKSGAGTQARSAAPRVRRKMVRPGYVAAETVLASAQFAWIIAFAMQEHLIAAAGSAWLAICILGLRLAPDIARKAWTPRHNAREAEIAL